MRVSCCLKDKNAHHSALQETDIEGFHQGFRATSFFLRVTLPLMCELGASPSSRHFFTLDALCPKATEEPLDWACSSGFQQDFLLC
jgi:hypothetical protein